MYQKLPTYELPDNYAALPEDVQREWDAFHRGYQLIHTMLNECVADMIAVGIPIQNDKIIDCGLTITPRNSQATCGLEDTDDGPRFVICVYDRMTRYLDNAEVMTNVKNSIYHELLHTIQGADTHNAIFQKWGKFCDAKLGTHTMWSMNNAVFYRTTQRKILVYSCPRCGFVYLTTTPNVQHFCDGCQGKMERQ